jgi:NTE family protein
MKKSYYYSLFFYQFDRVFARTKKDKIGLVLSGGGARFSYWSFKVLEEAGVKIDYIGGTSMGAVIGGLTLLDIMQLKLILFFNRQISVN